MPPQPSNRPSLPQPSAQSTSYRWFAVYFVSVACVWLLGVLLLASLSNGTARTRFADRFIQSSNTPPLDTAPSSHTQAQPRTQTSAGTAATANPCTGVRDDGSVASHRAKATGNHVYLSALPPWLTCILDSPLLSSPPAVSSLPDPLDFPIDDSAMLTECQRADFGAQLLRNWQAASTVECASEGGSGGGVIYEHRIRQARHSGDDFYLELHDVTLSPHRAGRLHVRCKPSARLASSRTYKDQQGLEDVRQLLNTNDAVPGTPQTGPAYTLIVRRDCDGVGNLYHCSADLINTFMLLHSIQLARGSAAASKLPPPTHNNTLVLFTDDNPTLTKFSLLWQALSPASAPFAAYRTGLTSPLSLPRVYGALQSGANMIWKDFWFEDPCGAVSPILDAFSRFATAIYLPQPLSSWLASADTQPSKGSKAIRVLLASRQTAAYRRASNEDELARHLASELPAGSSIVLVDLGSLTFEQQVAAVNSADLLVGMHGAALNLLLFVLPERRRVELGQGRLHLMELFISDKDRPRTYANMAVRLGIGYGSWVGPTTDKDLKEIAVDVNAIGVTIKLMYS